LSRNRSVKRIERRLDPVARRLIGLQVLVVVGQQEAALAGFGVRQLAQQFHQQHLALLRQADDAIDLPLSALAD
jgi:hypothetical protein